MVFYHVFYKVLKWVGTKFVLRETAIAEEGLFAPAFCIVRAAGVERDFTLSIRSSEAAKLSDENLREMRG